MCSPIPLVPPTNTAVGEKVGLEAELLARTVEREGIEKYQAAIRVSVDITRMYFTAEAVAKNMKRLKGVDKWCLRKGK